MKKLLRCFGVTAFGIIISINTVSAQLCGSCDGTIRPSLGPADIACMIEYLYRSGPWFEGNMMDIDDYEGVTGRDLVFLTDHVGTDFGPIFCPPSNPPFVLVPDSSFLVEYTDIVPANTSLMKVPIYLTISHAVNIIQLPFRLRIGEETPRIDSIVIPMSGLENFRIDTSSGEFAIFMYEVFSQPVLGLEVGKKNRLASVYISFPPSPVERTLNVDWTILSPIMAPTPDSTIIPALFFTRKDGAGVFAPSKRSFICGDIDGSGTGPDIADLTFLIDHLFINFPPLANPITGNIDGSSNGNASSDIDITDLTTLIDHLFINFTPVGC